MVLALLVLVEVLYSNVYSLSLSLTLGDLKDANVCAKMLTKQSQATNATRKVSKGKLSIQGMFFATHIARHISVLTIDARCYGEVEVRQGRAA
jgi:hypothetical protein